MPERVYEFDPDWHEGNNCRVGWSTAPMLDGVNLWCATHNIAWSWHSALFLDAKLDGGPIEELVQRSVRPHCPFSEPCATEVTDGEAQCKTHRVKWPAPYGEDLVPDQCPVYMMWQQGLKIGSQGAPRLPPGMKPLNRGAGQ